MQKKTQRLRVHVDAYTKVCLTVIAVLLTVLIIGLWADGPETSDDLSAAEKWLNTGKQREEMVKAQDKTTDKITELMELLKSGKVRVKVIGSMPEAPEKEDADGQENGES